VLVWPLDIILERREIALYMCKSSETKSYTLVFMVYTRHYENGGGRRYMQIDVEGISVKI
jgi:hypothetical protein